MLNPSTADAEQDDPTIRRCIGFARSWGYNVMTVRNIFPFRATNPKALRSAENPRGGHRGVVELTTALSADLTVVAWGAGVPFSADKDALLLFAATFPAKPLHCLGTTKAGHPRHPLYVAASAQPVAFENPYKQPSV